MYASSVETPKIKVRRNFLGMLSHEPKDDVTDERHESGAFRGPDLRREQG